MRYTFKVWLSALLLTIAVAYAHAQAPNIDPTSQIQWNLWTGASTPTAACTQNGQYATFPYGAQWGQWYLDQDSDTWYGCGPSGWVAIGSGGGGGLAAINRLAHYSTVLQGVVSQLSNTTGQADATVLLAGDSTTLGFHCGGPTATSTGGGTTVDCAFPALEAADLGLNSQVQVLHTGWFGGGASCLTLNNYVTVGSGWTCDATHTSIDGPTLTATSGAGALCTTTYGTDQIDNFKLYYVQDTGEGAGTITIGSETPVAFNASGTQAPIELTVPSTTGVGAKTACIAPTSGTIHIIGVTGFNSTRPSLMLLNLGYGGSTVANFSGTTYAYSPGHPAIWQLINPAGIEYESGINEPAAGISTSTMLTDLTTMYTAWQGTSADIVLATPTPYSTATKSQAIQASYAAVISTFAASNSNLSSPTTTIPLNDRYAAFNAIGGWVGTNARGWGYDTIHFNQAGYQAMANGSEAFWGKLAGLPSGRNNTAYLTAQTPQAQVVTLAPNSDFKTASYWTLGSGFAATANTGFSVASGSPVGTNENALVYTLTGTPTTVTAYSGPYNFSGAANTTFCANVQAGSGLTAGAVDLDISNGVSGGLPTGTLYMLVGEVASAASFQNQICGTFASSGVTMAYVFFRLNSVGGTGTVAYSEPCIISGTLPSGTPCPYVQNDGGIGTSVGQSTGAFNSLTSPNSTITVTNGSTANPQVDVNFSYTGATGWSGASAFYVPVHTGYTPTANGQFGFDSTYGNYWGYAGGAKIFPGLTNSGWTTGDLVSMSYVGSRYTLTDAGGPIVLLSASNTWTAQQLFPASTTGAAPINLGQGTAPTSPNNGDIWITSGGLYARYGGATVGPFGTGGGGSMTWPSLPGIPVCTGTPCTAWGTSLAAPAGTIVGTTDTQTLTNKTLDGVTPATMGYLDATSSIQTQLNGKQASLGFTPTNAAVVPSTAPSAGQLLVGNAGGTAYAPLSLSGDCTLAATGAITCTKSSGTAFGTGAFATIANYLTTATAASTYETQTAAALLAPLASPTFTGTPAAPTQTIGDNTTKVATDAFVNASITANAYTLPQATASVLGGIKGDGSSVALSSGVLSEALPFTSLTTTGTSGAASISAGVLNIPQYSGGGGTTTNALTMNNSNSGASSGSTFNGASAVTISTNTIGAPNLTTANAMSGVNTFSAAGALSAYGFQISGTPITSGGTGTTTFPLACICTNGATAPTTWSTVGTLFGINAASGFTGNLLDFHINGAASIFGVSYQGAISAYTLTTTRGSSTGASYGFQPGAYANSGLFSSASGVDELGSGNTVGGAVAKLILGGVQSGGTTFTASGCSNGTLVGGASAGKMTLGANTCSVTVTMGNTLTATNGWSCRANDETTAAGNTGLYFSANNATTATLVVPATAGSTDVIDFACMAF